MDWKAKARWEVLRAAHSSDPEDVPVYRVPKHREWWEFWKPVEWDEVRGMSRAQGERLEEMMRADRIARAKIMDERGVTSPYANLYAPWVTEEMERRRVAPSPNSEGA